jgi:hypothetical protein
MNTIDVNIAGNHKLQKAILAILPLVPEYFAAMDGQRITIASGAKSAPFRKACEAFREACKAVSDASIWIDSAYSPRINVKVMSPSGEHSVAYFETAIYLGNQTDQCLSYTFDPARYEADALNVLAFDRAKLDAIAETYSEQIKRAQSTLEALPYRFRELIRS